MSKEKLPNALAELQKVLLSIKEDSRLSKYFRPQTHEDVTDVVAQLRKNEEDVEKAISILSDIINEVAYARAALNDSDNLFCDACETWVGVDVIDLDPSFKYVGTCKGCGGPVIRLEKKWFNTTNEIYEELEKCAEKHGVRDGLFKLFFEGKKLSDGEAMPYLFEYPKLVEIMRESKKKGDKK